jgi:putative transposase
MIFDKHPELGSKWDRKFWTKGYYVTTVGNVNEETIKRCIQKTKGRRKACRNKKVT